MTIKLGHQGPGAHHRKRVRHRDENFGKSLMERYPFPKIFRSVVAEHSRSLVAEHSRSHLLKRVAELWETN